MYISKYKINKFVSNKKSSDLIRYSFKPKNNDITKNGINATQPFMISSAPIKQTTFFILGVL